MSNPTALSIYNKIVAWWERDETSGSDMLDKHYNQLHGTYSGMTLNQTALATNLGASILFSGSNAYANVQDSPLLRRQDNFAVMVWARRQGAQAALFPKLIWKPGGTKTSGHATYLLSSETGNSNRVQFRITTMNTDLTLNSYTVVSTTGMADNTNYCIIGNRNNLTLELYMNDIGEGTQSITAGTISVVSQEPLRWGYHGATNDNFVGRQDQTALFNTTLDGTERAYLYNSGNGVTYDSLYADAGSPPIPSTTRAYAHFA